jgi:CubicO group peptidase (beta-lactamase class C family)
VLIFLAALLQASSPSAAAEAWIQEQMTARKIPGLSVAVVQDGRILFQKAHGAASIELDVPVTAATRFAIASTTKAVSSTAVLLLVSEGRVRLDQPVGSIVPDLPPAWQPVTIRQLLSHTSGLPDIIDSPNTGVPIAGTRDSALSLAGGHPPAFAPGTAWAYNQTNYVLLGMVVERLAGMPFTRFILERIAAPLGLGSAVFADARTPLVNRSYTYTRFAMTPAGPTPLDSLRTIQFTYPGFMYMAAGLNITAGDLARFGDAVRAGKVLPPALRDTLWTAVKLSDGSVFRFGGESGFGLGWQVDDTPGGRWVGMEGGASSALRVFPDHKLTVAVLTNLQGAGPGELAMGLARFWTSPGR